uniref:PAT1 domain-containing protein n=1 Tax=Rhabditophanes sp. KR3021 TaxID=114890 RepID=A0AC35U241_9BILA
MSRPPNKEGPFLGASNDPCYESIDNCNADTFGGEGDPEFRDLLDIAAQTADVNLFDTDLRQMAPDACELPLPDKIPDFGNDKKVYDIWSKLIGDDQHPDSSNDPDARWPSKPDGHIPVKLHNPADFMNRPTADLVHPIPIKPTSANLNFDYSIANYPLGIINPMLEAVNGQDYSNILLSDLFKDPVFPTSNQQPFDMKMFFPPNGEQFAPPHHGNNQAMGHPNNHYQQQQQQQIRQYRQQQGIQPQQQNQFQHKKPNHGTFPSKQTIGDYAFDPFKGLMSQKEREWLMKIQLIQSTTTGDPNNDDYYYVNWKKRNLLIARPQVAKTKERVKAPYYDLKNIVPSSGYSTPQFSGALGRVTTSSSIAPKQYLDLSNSFDNESVYSDNKPTRKLKSILMAVENSLTSLLEIDNNQLTLQSGRVTQENGDALVAQNNQRIANIKKLILESDFSSKCLLASKARHFLALFLGYMRDPVEVANYINQLSTGYLKYNKKVNDTQLIESFITAIKVKIFSLHELQFKTFLEHLSTDFFKNTITSNFATLFCFILLIKMCSIQNAILAKDLVSHDFAWILQNRRYARLTKIPETQRYFAPQDVFIVQRGFNEKWMGVVDGVSFENSVFFQIFHH